MKSPGIRVCPIRRIDGGHEFNEVFLDDVRVPVEDRVGQERQGWKTANYLLGHERGNMSLVVMIEEMFDTLREINTDHAGSMDVATTTSFKRTLVGVEIDYMVVRHSAEKIMRAVTADSAVGHVASVVKLGRTRATQSVARLMLEAGGYSATASDPMAIRGESAPPEPKLFFRIALEYFDLRKVSIASGSTEIQKDLVARRMLGL